MTPFDKWTMTPTPKRVRMTRAKGGWRHKHPDAVIVSRGPGRIFGNPWRLENGEGRVDFFTPEGRFVLADCHCPHADSIEAVVALYETWIRGEGIGGLPSGFTQVGRDKWRKSMVARRVLVIDRLPDLRGRDLACWCYLCDRHKDGLPLGETCDDCAQCHGDVLLALANEGER